MVTRPGVTRIAFCLIFGLVASAATTKTKASAPKAKTAAAAVAHRPASAKSSAQKSQAKAPSRSTAKPVSRTQSRRSTTPLKTTYRKVSSPIAPASDRIREVQQALIERGFLSGSPTGIWNAESMEALKKFETAQNMKVDGKIDSKALIQLGLGPQYDRNLALPVPAAGGAVLADENRIQFDPQRQQ